MNKPFYHIFCFLILSFSSFGQNDYLFNVRQFSAEDGMLGRRINAILDDKDGFVWIATNEGLNRFDGYKFEHFTKSSHGLSANNIYTLNIDDENDIWITYNQDRFLASPTQIFRPSENRVLSLQEKLGDAYQEKLKTVRLTKANNKHIILFYTDDYEFYIYAKGKVIPYAHNNLTGNKKNEEFWFNEEAQYYQTNLNGDKLDSIQSISDCEGQNLLFCRSGSTFFICENEVSNTVFYKNVNSSSYSEVVRYNKKDNHIHLRHGIWIESKVYFEYDNQVLSFDMSNFSKRKPRFLYTDAQNNVWLGMNDGIFLLSVKKQNFKLYLKDAGENNSIYDGRGIWADNKTMFAFSGSGAYQYDFATEQKKLLFPEKPSHFSPNAVAEASDGNLQAYFCLII